MKPPVYEICSADAVVDSWLGDVATGQLRLYAFGYVPQGMSKPFCVWQITSGAPENYLGQRPDVDAVVTQFDVYAPEAQDARDIVDAIRDAIEPYSYITSWDGEGFEAVTKLHRITFIADWFVNR